MLGLLIVAGIVVVAVVAWGLHKSGKAVTTGNVVSAVEADAKAAEANVASAVANTASKL